MKSFYYKNNDILKLGKFILKTPNFTLFQFYSTQQKRGQSRRFTFKLSLNPFASESVCSCTARSLEGLIALVTYIVLRCNGLLNNAFVNLNF